MKTLSMDLHSHITKEVQAVVSKQFELLRFDWILYCPVVIKNRNEVLQWIIKYIFDMNFQSEF